ncbi:MAG: hypothetical protein FJ144_11535 [Deltaproteobacteria bacterium]|nr:hypothetical protein [Deltaproteobacteria bacterium]
MNPELVLRRALGLSVVFNVMGALLFAFPDSLPGRLAGLPPDVPGLYRGLVALFVLLFAGSYLWLARSANLDRAFVTFAAIGKTSAFLLILAFWLFGEAPLRGVLAMSGDLAFAAVFAWCLSRLP